jgi:hypothetical protein
MTYNKILQYKNLILITFIAFHKLLLSVISKVHCEISALLGLVQNLGNLD